MTEHNSSTTNTQGTNAASIEQPLTPEQISPEQERARKEAMRSRNWAINPGDRDHSDKTLPDKARQVAVNAPDITGDHIVVPTYFIARDAEGKQKALHHVKDAEEISDVIRQARMNEDGEREWR